MPWMLRRSFAVTFYESPLENHELLVDVQTGWLFVVSLPEMSGRIQCIVPA